MPGPVGSGGLEKGEGARMKAGEAKKVEAHGRYLDREAYREALEEMEELLSFVFFRLDELKADLAVEGSHKEWAQAQGSVLELDEIDFARSDDPLVRDVDALHLHLRLVLDKLPVGPARKRRAERFGLH